MQQINSIEENKRLQTGLVLTVVLVAGLLRLYRLGEWSFWIEEFHSIRDIHELLDGGVVAFLGDSLRPFYYLLAAPFMQLLGDGEWAARLFPLLVGLVTLPVAFVIVRRWYSARVALLTIGLLAIAPWHIYWSQNARFYTLLLLLFTLAVYNFYQLVETDNGRYLLWAMLFFFLASITHTIGAILLPIFTVYFLAAKYLPYPKPAGLKWRNLLAFIALPVVGYLLFELYRLIIGQPLLGVVIYRNFFNEDTVSYVGYGSPLVLLTSVAYYVGVPLILLAFVGMVGELLHGRKIGLLVVISAALPLAAFTLLTLIATTANRYVFMTLFFWVLLAALGINHLYRSMRAGQYGLLGALALLMLIGFWRDPVRRDLQHYFSDGLLLLAVVVVGIIALLVARKWVQKNGLSFPLATMFTGVVALTVVHALLVVTMYFAYQHGHRNDWRSLMTAVNQADSQAQTSRDIVAGLVPLAEIYAGRTILSIASTDLDQMLAAGNAFWVLQDGVVEQVKGSAIRDFYADHCVLVVGQQEFTAGQWWPLNAYLCQQ